MLRRVTSWPKIIALLVGGLAVTVLSSAFLVNFARQNEGLTCDWSAVAVSALLFVMSGLLFTERELARRILLFIVIVVGMIRVFIEGVGAVAPIHYLSAISPDRARLYSLEKHLRYLSSCFLALSLLVFAVLFLCHPHVVASFRGHSRSSPKV
jgi:hypothetical protein